MKAPDDKLDFAAGLKELEEITAWFESEQVDLDKALIKFERGVELAAKLREHLKAVENRVDKIKQKFNAATVGPEPIEELVPGPEVSDPELF